MQYDLKISPQGERSRSFALFAGLISAGHAGLAVVFVSLLVLGMALGHLGLVKPFAQIVNLLMALASAGFGVWRSVRGERFRT